MTYDRIKLDDMQMLDVLHAARENRALVCVHAENHAMISWTGNRLLANGYRAPRYHAVSHPRACEAEAFNRVIALAAFIDQPIMIFHVSSAEGVRRIRQARGEGLKVFAETCPQYLFLTAQDMDRPELEGAKWICSPPLRRVSDQEALWRALALGDLQTVSSDHAPYRADRTGKFVVSENPSFKEIPNGIPGLEARLPLLFDAMVSQGRLGLEKFVSLTSTEPAKIYGLHPKKGDMVIGGDADIVLWDPNRVVTITGAILHDRTGYSPYEGRIVTGWPVTVLSRGRVVVEDGTLCVAPGSGRFIPRAAGIAATPTGRRGAEFDPDQNFGAHL